MTLNKMFLKFIQKCQISKFVFDPLQTSPFGRALAPQGDLKSKKLPRQKVVRI
jgi:hypothetical protein